MMSNQEKSELPITGRLNLLGQAAFVILFATLIFFLANSIFYPTLNNGDYNRVLQSIGIEIDYRVAFGECIPFSSQHLFLPVSPAAAYGFLLGEALRHIGVNCFSMVAWGLGFSLIFWLGALATLVKFSWPCRLVGLMFHILLYLTFFPLIYSFYEESILFAFAPWLPLVSTSNLRVSFFSGIFACCIFAAKVQAIFLFPFILVWSIYRGGGGAKSILLFSALASIGLAYSLSRPSNGANDFNRIYNGIGWSVVVPKVLQGRDFYDRQAIFNELQKTGRLGSELLGACSPEGYKLMGSTYWPTIDNLRSEGDAFIVEYIESLSLRSFWNCWLETGNTFEFIESILYATATSNYSLDYIAQRRDENFSPILGAVLDFSEKSIGLMFLIFSILSAYFSRGSLFFVPFGLSLMILPVLVVLGDGFYEFEKHMMPNFILLSCHLFLVLDWISKKQNVIKTELEVQER